MKLIEILGIAIVIQEAENHIHRWSIDQITSSKELQVEGNAMRHCVSSYVPYCRSGEISIWTMREDGCRKVTIEVRNSTIVQARGLANRPIRPTERFLLNRWASQNNLSINRYI